MSGPRLLVSNFQRESSTTVLHHGGSQPAPGWIGLYVSLIYRNNNEPLTQFNPPLLFSGDPEGFAHLTELANDLLGSGDFDIYQKTKEVLEDLVASSEKKINGDSELDALGAVIDDEAGIERPGT